MGLKAAGVSVGYGGPPVVEGVDLEVREGELLAIVGPNGSGKTTLLRALAGTLKLTAGEVSVDDASLASLRSRERARRIAVVPQGQPLEFAFTVREVVEMGRTPFLSGWGAMGGADHEAVDSALKRAGIGDLAALDSTTISAGQAQLMAVARALAQEPRVLLLDEPTAHLDVTHQIQIMDAVRKLVRDGNLTAVAVLHDLNLAATYADRIALVSKGRVRAVGPPGEVLTRALVASTFGLDVLVRRHPVSGAFFVVPVAVALDAEALGAPRTPHAKVHLVCGGGTGAPLMGELVRLGFEVSVGVVNVLDTDFEVAEALGLRVVAEAPFSGLTQSSVGEARALAEAAEVTILTAVPFGPSNVQNLALLEAAQAKGRRVVIMDVAGVGKRDFSEGAATERISKLLAEGDQGGVSTVPDAAALLAALRALPTAAAR